jgi:hypothetical protein
MRMTLLLPPRLSWPISADGDGGAYEWKRKPPDIPATGTFSLLPDGRYQLRIDGLLPVVIGRVLFAGASERRLWAIVRLLAFHADWFCAMRGLPVPKKTGRFVECGDEFVLEDELNPYRFARLRVPKRNVGG